MLRALSRAATTRFVAVGLTMTVLHLAVFRLLLPWSVPEVANVAAFVVATQVNFVLSYYWTWSARHPVGREAVRSVARRAALFNGSATLGLGVNSAGFAMALRVFELPPLHSALAATVASATVTFLLSSRVVFARRRTVPDSGDVAELVGDGTDPARTPGIAPAPPTTLPHFPPPLEGSRR